MTRLVAALLLVWEPLNFAIEALTVLPTLAYRGWLAALELAFHGAAALLAAGGGAALWNRSQDSTRLATAAIVVAVLRNLQSIYWSVLPNAAPPDQKPLIAGSVLLIGSLSLLALHAGRR
jgi:hypothetical protein